jgi:hypothetical protein
MQTEPVGKPVIVPPGGGNVLHAFGEAVTVKRRRGTDRGLADPMPTADLSDRRAAAASGAF